MSREIGIVLMSAVDVIIATYVVLFALGAYFWIRTERRSLEVALFLLSMVVMPLIYFAMFDWDRTGVAIFAPQSFALALLACLTVAGFWKGDLMAVPVLVGLSFVVNVLGYGWTRAILSGP
jgi:hypothetical protein